MTTQNKYFLNHCVTKSMNDSQGLTYKKENKLTKLLTSLVYKIRKKQNKSQNKVTIISAQNQVSCALLFSFSFPFFTYNNENGLQVNLG